MEKNEDFVGDRLVTYATEDPLWVDIGLAIAVAVVIVLGFVGSKPLLCWSIAAAVIWIAIDVGVHLYLKGKKKQEEEIEENDPLEVYGNTRELMEKASLRAILTQALEETLEKIYKQNPELLEDDEDMIEEYEEEDPCDGCSDDCGTCPIWVLKKHPEVLDLPPWLIKLPPPEQRDRP